MTAVLIAAGLIAAHYARRLYRIHQAHRAYDHAMTVIRRHEQQAAADLIDCQAIWALTLAERKGTP